MTGRLQAGDTGTQVVWRLQNQRARSSSSWSKDVKNCVVSPEVWISQLQGQEKSTLVLGRKTHSLSVLFFWLNGPAHNEREPLFQSRVMWQSLLQRSSQTPSGSAVTDMSSLLTLWQNSAVYKCHQQPSLSHSPTQQKPSIFEVYNFALGCIGGHLWLLGCMACLRLHRPASVFQLFFISI